MAEPGRDGARLLRRLRRLGLARGPIAIEPILGGITNRNFAMRAGEQVYPSASMERHARHGAPIPGCGAPWADVALHGAPGLVPVHGAPRSPWSANPRGWRLNCWFE
jgi:hypothetical protein